MAIRPSEIGADENAARRVLVKARSIAPCIDSFPEGSEDKKNAVAILSNIYDEVKARGARNVRSQGIASARVEYDIGSAFTDDDRTSLRALCATVTPRPMSAEAPLGSFPRERPVGRVWRETY